LRILGIDPSLCKTGWGVIDISDGEIYHIEHGLIVTKSQDSMPRRLYTLSHAIANIYNQYKPNRIAIEEAFCGVNNKTNLKLGFAFGAIISTLGQHEHTETIINTYSPRLVKMHLVHGNATKHEIRTKVRWLLGVEVKGLDMSDALAVAICDGMR
jgi:crossover junction endodeoxyribonuclease RuvC